MYAEHRLGWAAKLWSSGGDQCPSLVGADGCVDVIWRDGSMLLSGPTTAPLALTASGPAMGLRLRPGIGGAFFDAPLHELANQCADLTAVLPDLPSALLSRAADDPAVGLRQLLDHVQTLAQPRALAVRAALLRLSDAGASAEAAALTLGFSTRQARRETVRIFGYGYRTLVGIRRARRAGWALRAGRRPADVAVAMGFSDQPHLTRDVKRYLGQTPAQLGSGANRSTALPSGSMSVA